MQLDILGVSYKLDFTSELPDFQGHDSLGTVDNQTCEVKIYGANETQKLWLLIHEILHTLTYMGHLQFLRVEGQQYDDEAKIDAVASLLSEIIKRNPMVFIKLIEEPVMRGGSS